jgi:transcriptional regulator with XRE-family HTH domain
MSQEALALEAEMDRSYVGGIERGEHNIALVNLHKLCVALQLSMADLLARTGF